MQVNREYRRGKTLLVQQQVQDAEALNEGLTRQPRRCGQKYADTPLIDQLTSDSKDNI